MTGGNWSRIRDSRAIKKNEKTKNIKEWRTGAALIMFFVFSFFGVRSDDCGDFFYLR